MHACIWNLNCMNNEIKLKRNKVKIETSCCYDHVKIHVNDAKNNPWWAAKLGKGKPQKYSWGEYGNELNNAFWSLLERMCTLIKTHV